MRRMKLSALLSAALMMAGCGADRAPANVSGLRQALGRSLAGVEGKTDVDQRRIAIRHARECAAHLWPKEC